MLIWEGMHQDGKIPVVIRVEYDEEVELYIIEVSRGKDKNFKTFTPKHIPDGLMHVADMEKAIKKANSLVKELKRDALEKR